MTDKKVQEGKITDLKPDPQNARAHNPRNLGMIEDALHNVGAARSIVVDEDNVILAGNGVVEAAATAGIERVRVIEADGEEIIAVRRSGLTPDQKKALAYYDNRTAELAAWDAEQIIADLDDGFDFDGLFGRDELDALVASVSADFYGDEGAPDPEDPDADDFGEVRPVRGDVWLVESKSQPGTVHRVMCGDSTDADDVARLNLPVDAALFTDPPYGINLEPAGNRQGWGNAPQRFSNSEKIIGDDGSLDLSFLFDFERRMIWGFPYIYDPAATGWIVWDKQPGVDSRGIVTPVEMASTTLRKGFDMVRVMWGGYYRAAGETREPHPTQKPVSVVAPFIEQWTEQAATVYDPFLGSGTTLIAAEQLGRTCYGCEISERYCEVILRRAEAMGLTVQREDIRTS